MPLYEYECTACHKRTEKIQKFSDPEITDCPKCGGTLERVLSAPAISFKGGGWYADGYGNAKPAASEGSGKEGGGSETKPATEGAAESKSESKSGSKTESQSGDAGKSGNESKPAKEIAAPAAPAASAPATAPVAAKS